MMKRAQISTWEVIGTIALIMVVLLITTNAFGNQSLKTFQISDKLQLQGKNKLCEVSGRQILDNGVLNEPIEGNKGDGFPDDCDICLGGDNKIISNSDGIPDACYVNSATNKNVRTYKDMCKSKNGCYISATDQCCIGEARSKCGSECK